MVRERLAGLIARGHVPGPSDGQAGVADTGGASRRTVIARGLSLLAGAVGVGVAGSIAGSAERRPHPAVAPAAAAPVAARPTELALYVRDIRFARPDRRPGELSIGKVLTAPHGDLVDADGSRLGTFASGVLPGSGGHVAFQRFVFAGGTLIGMGSGAFDEEYAVVGGTGTYAGAIGTYRARLQPGARGQDAEFSFNVTGMR